MGKKKTMLPGTRPYGTKTRYSSETLEQVVEDIRCGKIGQREAARLYSIPRQTLVNKLKNEHCKKIGRPTVFSLNEEATFVEHCVVLSEMGIPVSMFDLRCIVKSYLDTQKRVVKCFPGNMPGWEWGKSFLERHKNMLQEKFAKNITKKRAAVDEGTIKKFFINFEKEVQEPAPVPPENIFNFDETGFCDSPSKGKLLFRRSSRNPEKIINSSKVCYTVLMCGSADGQFLPPYFVFKGKQKWNDWLLYGPPGSRMNVSPSGWMEISIFEDWFEYHFLPVVRKLEGSKILIGDNHSSHLSLRTLELCKAHNIKFICLPPNATHLLQPLDVACFSALKSNWRQILTEWRKTPQGKKKACLSKPDFVQLLAKTLVKGESTASSNMIKGFEKCGLLPVNCQKVLDNLPGYTRQEAVVRDLIGKEFKSYMEGIRNSDLMTKAVKRFRLPVEPGRSVSFEEVRQFQENRESFSSTGSTRKRQNYDAIGGDECSTRSQTNEKTSRNAINFGPQTRGGLSRRTGRYVRTVGETSRAIMSGGCSASSVNSLSEKPDTDNQENSIHVDSSLMFSIDDFVIVSYEGSLFPGIVTGFEISGPTTSYRVSCMVKKGRHWMWPEKPDEVWYQQFDLIKKVENYRAINKRGMYEVKDSILCSDSEESS